MEETIVLGTSTTPPSIARFLRGTFVLMSVLLLAACSSGGGAPAPAESFAGSWQGTWQSSRGSGGSLTATFRQTDDSLSGSVSLTGSPCLSSGIISGTVTDSGATFGAVDGPDRISFVGGYPRAGVLSGTYSVAAGFCFGDAGTFSVVRSR